MSGTSCRDVLILGGGLAGLFLARELARCDLDFLVVEKEAAPGGLARTFRRGDFGYDIGGHRFYTDLPRIDDELVSLMGDELLLVNRRSRIRLDNQYFDYPLRLSNVLPTLGPRRSAAIFRDFVLLLTSRRSTPEDSFESWVINRFGPTLYGIYFRPYTEKVWGMPCSQVSSDWAAQRITVIGLTDALRKMLVRPRVSPRTYVPRFYYPRQGIGRLADRVVELVDGDGRRVMLCAEVVRVRHSAARIGSVVVRVGDRLIELGARQVVSTLPLTDLVRSLYPPPPEDVLAAARELGYRAVVLVCLVVDRPKLSDDTWTYFPDRDLTFGRMHEPANWSPYLTRPGMTSACLEIYCDAGDEVWREPADALVERCLGDVERIGFLSRREVLDAHVERVDHAYPVYRVGYQRQLRTVKDYLARFANLRITGRTGAFEYLNMDQVWAKSLDVAEQLVEQVRRDLAAEPVGQAAGGAQ